MCFYESEEGGKVERDPGGGEDEVRGNTILGRDEVNLDREGDGREGRGETEGREWRGETEGRWGEIGRAHV